MQLIDLHVHSTASDGTLTPTEVTNLALQCGLTAYALTDHDTVDGVAEAMQAAENTSLTVIPGAEFSSPYEGKEIHILGLYLNPHCPELLSALRQVREIRNGAMKSFSLYFRQMDFPLNMKI
ncbi:MAG: PHP domain-containing protein [Clostridium fessum]